jgi:hypothetical protein
LGGPPDPSPLKQAKNRELNQKTNRFQAVPPPNRGRNLEHARGAGCTEIPCARDHRFDKLVLNYFSFAEVDGETYAHRTNAMANFDSLSILKRLK